jgi:hypothetical protein
MVGWKSVGGQVSCGTGSRGYGCCERKSVLVSAANLYPNENKIAIRRGAALGVGACLEGRVHAGASEPMDKRGK